jgi:hypothetical protein
MENLSSYITIITCLYVPLIGMWTYWLAKGDSTETRKWVVRATWIQILIPVNMAVAFYLAFSRANVTIISPVLLVFAYIPTIMIYFYYYTVAKRFAKIPVG